MPELPFKSLGTIFTDTAGNYKQIQAEGHTLQLVHMSHPDLVIYVSPTPNPSNRIRLRRPGDGWKNISFNGLYLSWDAYPGGEFELSASGNSLRANEDLQERLIGPSLDQSVTISGQPLSVNATPVGNTPVTQATDPWIVKQDTTEVLADDMKLSGTPLSISHGSFVSGASLVYTVPTGKVAVIQNMTVGGSGGDRIGHVYIQNASSTEVWRRAFVAGNEIPIEKPLKLTTGYKLYQHCLNSTAWVVAAGYIYDA